MRALIAVLILLVGRESTAATLLVPGQYASVQAGLDAASWGDTVRVECGTYLEHDLFMKSGVVLVSETGASDCAILDAQQQGRVMIATGLDDATRIEGFTFRNGLAPGDYGYGGGLFAVYADLTMVACRFETNTAGFQGGGAYLDQSDATFEQCWFVSNVANTWGGGVYTYYASPLFDRCRFITNQGWFMGAGAMFDKPSDPRVVDCVFRANTSDLGGGAVVMDGARVTFLRSTFRHHVINGSGGGLDIWRSPGVVVEKCDFWNNRAGSSGGAIRFFDGADATVRGCTVYANQASFGAAFYSYQSDPIIETTIVAENSGSAPAVCSTNGGTFTLLCTDVWNNPQGDFVGCLAGQDLINDNFSANPLLCNPAGADFSLATGSPCLPEASPCGVLVGAYGEGCVPAAADVMVMRAVLHPNRPNPFNPHTVLALDLHEATDVDLAVYDLAGRRVRVLADGMLAAGPHAMPWDGRDERGHDVASGVYLARLSIASGVQVQRMVLLR